MLKFVSSNAANATVLAPGASCGGWSVSHMRTGTDPVRAIRDVTRAGIFRHGFFMLGFPTETLPEMRQTIAFAAGSPLHTASFFVVKPVPGKALHAFAQAHNALKTLEKPSDFAYATFSYACSDVASRVLRRGYRFSYLNFYLKPCRIKRIMLDFPDKRRLLFNLLHLMARITGYRRKNEQNMHREISSLPA